MTRMTPEEYRASLQPQVDAGMIPENVADMLAEDYAEMESEWQIAKQLLGKFEIPPLEE